MKTFTVVYKRAGFANYLRLRVQAYDGRDAMAQFDEQVASRHVVGHVQAYAGNV